MSIQAKLAAALILVLGLICSHWYAYRAGDRNGTNALKVEYAQTYESAVEVARLKERSWSKQVEEARNDATKRETNLRRDAAGARTAADGLRDELGEIRRQLPSLAADACRSRADTLAAILDQCQGNYRGLAEAADRHVSDKQTLMDAWPK